VKLCIFHIVAMLSIISLAYPQSTLQSEQWQAETYIVTFKSNPADSWYAQFGKMGVGLQSAGEYEADAPPSQNLFIALPPLANPQIRTIPNTIEHHKVKANNDIAAINSDVAVLKGFMWIGNNYCAHIVFNPVSYDKNTGNIVIVKEFTIEITMPKTVLQYHSRQISPVDPIVDNKNYAKQWQSTSSQYPVSQTDAWIDYSSEYVKIGVVHDGIFRITYNDMISYGAPVGSLNPKNIRMYLKGKEVPLFIHGEEDMKFDQGDFIEFVGRRNYGDADYRAPAVFGAHYNEYLNIYSDTTIYWITWSGGLGQRIDTTITAGSGPNDTLRYYDELIHIERNVSWDFSLNPNNLTPELRKNYPELLENETWYDGNLSVGKYSEMFVVSNLFPNRPARAFAKLQNFSSSVDQKAHNLALSLNNSDIKYDSGFINKYQVKTLTANFSSSVLNNGINNLNIHSYATSNTVNVVARDWTEIEYPRYLTTANDSFSISYSTITTPKPYLVILTGITSGNFSFYKYRTTDSVFYKITNYYHASDTVKFYDSVSNITRYYLLREEKIPSPIFFYKTLFTNLRNPSNKADYIAITHPYFQNVVSSYISFVASSYNITTKYVSVADIYDEFNFGFLSPEPIKDFLIAAQNNWQSPKPIYVTLIGKGTYDYYGNKTKYIGAPPVTNFVPVWGNPVSDNWFVQWDTTGSLIPQMSIGRIPVNSVVEFQGYFAKHQKYISKGFNDWNKRYIFFSGGNFTDPNQIAQSKGTNQYIIDNYVKKKPVGGNAINFYKTVNPITNFGPYSPEYIEQQIDQGGVFISYIGHSGTQTWDNSITDIVQLANSKDRNPLITDFGCSTGKFAEPDVISFSQLAVSGLQGQAIAYIGNASLGFTSTAYTFPITFYKKLLIDTVSSIGNIHRLAKIDYLKQNSGGSYGLFVKTNTLIGDPIVQLPVPNKPNLTFANAGVVISPDNPTEQTDSVTVHVQYFNLGSVVNDSVMVTVKVANNGLPVFYRIEKRAIPLYVDSLTFSFSIKNMPGEHVITVRIDSANSINEIYENDNVLTLPFLVASSSIRNISISTNENQTEGYITFLNPSVRPQQSNFTYEVSIHPGFSQIKDYTVPYDTFFTKISLDPVYQGKRIWVRTKYDNSNLVSPTISYFFGTQENVLFNDSSSFGSLQKEKTKYVNQWLLLDSTKVHFSAISAGWNDGKTAVITRDGINYIPESTKRAHHVCLFDAVTFEFKGYYLFDVLAGGTTVMTQYAQLLDTLSQDYLVIIAICDEGGLNLSTTLKNAIKSIGSQYIDSVQFRYSWAIIGRKGAAPGTVKEKFTRLFEGQVALDTTFYTPNRDGTFSTNLIGPVAKWKNIELTYSEQQQGNITMSAIGIKSDATEDTIKQWGVIDSVLDLSTINANNYPSIRLVGRMKRNTGEQSPSISSIGINFSGMAELDRYRIPGV